jgi:hypothetical protein
VIATRTAALSGFKGYDPKLFVNPIDGDFFCSLCSGVLRQGVVINGDPWYVLLLLSLQHLYIDLIVGTLDLAVAPFFATFVCTSS